MTTDRTEMEGLEAHADNAIYWEEQLEDALSQLRWWQAAIKRGEYVVMKRTTRKAVPEVTARKASFVYDDDLPHNP